MTTRRFLRGSLRALPILGILFAFSHLARGGFRGFSLVGWWEFASILLLLCGIGVVGWRRVRGVIPTLRDDLELGGCLLAASYAVVSLGGEALFPIIYLVVAFLVSFLPRTAGFTLLGVALVFDAMATLSAPNPRLSAFLARATFLLLFAALYHLVLAARLAMARSAESEAVQRRLKEVEERARTFRLVSAGSQDSIPGMKEQEKWLLASVGEIEGAVSAALEIAETSLRSHTCAAFLLSSDDRHLKLYDCRSASDRVQRDRLPAGEGILGGVLKRGMPLRMAADGGVKGVSWYDGGPQVGAILAVPIVEKGGHLRGILVADRLAATPFTEVDERLLSIVAAELLRGIEVERVMGYIRKTRDEKDRFFRAIEELNRANNADQVSLAVIESARQLAGLDFSAVTLVREVDGKRVHRVTRMTGVTAPGKALEGKVFADNNGLVANVVRYGAPLPGRDLKAMDKPLIFDDETQVRGLSALKIFPLTAGDKILGTLVAGARKKVAFDDEVLRMLEVLAIQAAQSLLRADLFEQMERMATTDGLTGLTNHRTFQARADELLAQSKRYGRKCAVMLTDIDHFKSVNDTYGHPIGDLVLKGVARIVRSKARDTDVVARYGGEEFAIVMPETDAKGAQVIAERIREAVQAEVFQTEMGPLKVTLSLGIACSPEHAADKQALIDLADQCLYFAKRHGRNQSVTVAQMQKPRLVGNQ